MCVNVCESLSASSPFPSGVGGGPPPSTEQKQKLCWWRLDRNCRLHCSCRFIRLYDNLSTERKKKEEEEKKRNKRRRWQERRPEEVKDSREKEFMEAYVSTLKDRGETETKT